MDFSQTKLTKMEWESIETPVSDQEKQVLRLIQNGYHNLNIKYNDNPSLLSHMKIEHSPEIEMYLYDKYFAQIVNDLLKDPEAAAAGTALTKKKSTDKKTSTAGGASNQRRSAMFAQFHPSLPNVAKFKPPKKIDLLRLQNMDNNLSTGAFDKTRIFEFIQLDFCQKILKESAAPTTTNAHSYSFYVYTLLHMNKAAVSTPNRFVHDFVHQLLVYAQTRGSEKLIRDVFLNAYTIIEKNPYLLRFDNKTLYDHQKQLFQLFRRPVAGSDESALSSPSPPKLVLYTAPTGTGKTMSPLGISEGYRVIYICAARHIGLALARSAISMEKRVAFAFGCETAADIRLHYYSAVDYTKHRKTGGIYKVDNSNGLKVEIMICDIHSYCTAMHYMLAFNEPDHMVLYWDEPTITLDLPDHSLHATIRKNWQENKIANIVLACATLPDESEMMDCLDDYRRRFDGGQVHRISSADCKKSISILNADGYTMLPHVLFSSYTELQQSVAQCETQMSLLRYLDLREIVRMIQHVECVPGALSEAFHVHNYFSNVDAMTMNAVKLYYVSILKELTPETYPSIHEFLKTTHRPMFMYQPAKVKGGERLVKRASVGAYPVDTPVATPHEGEGMVRSKSESGGLASTLPRNPFQGILLTTSDAHTLTDGPTIYLVEDVALMGQFYAQRSHIPIQVLEGLLSKIEENNQIQKKMDVLMKSLDDMIGKEVEKERKMSNDVLKPEAKRMMVSIEALRADIQLLSIGAKYTPNTRPHQQIWVDDVTQFVENAFVPSVDDASVLKIMELGVDAHMKLLLLMGIGVLDSTSGLSYLEIVKRLASQQKLFLIIASSDYIYGTNYQMCHGFLGKDLQNMTQQKIIQAMGRIGRSNIQQEYTVRFRDESLISRLFLPSLQNMEAVNMSKLLVE